MAPRAPGITATRPGRSLAEPAWPVNLLRCLSASYAETPGLGLLSLEFIARAFAPSLCLQQKPPALWVSRSILCVPFSQDPLPRGSGHPALGISFPTPTADSSRSCEGQLPFLSCRRSVGMPSAVRSPSPKSMPAPAQHPVRPAPSPQPRPKAKLQPGLGSCSSLLSLSAQRLSINTLSPCIRGERCCELRL